MTFYAAGFYVLAGFSVGLVAGIFIGVMWVAWAVLQDMNERLKRERQMRAWEPEDEQ